MEPYSNASKGLHHMSTLIVLGCQAASEVRHRKKISISTRTSSSACSPSRSWRGAPTTSTGAVVTPGSKLGNLRGVGSVLGHAVRPAVLHCPSSARRWAQASGALTGAIVKHGVDKDFQDRVRNLLSTDDSAAVFMVVDG